MKKFSHRLQIGQSTTELALLLPTLMFLVGMIIYVYKVNHKHSDKISGAYAEKMEKYHRDKMLYDPEKGIFVPEGEYAELIPDGANIDPSEIAKQAVNFLAQLGLSELFSRLDLDRTYYGAFAKGFTYSLAQKSLSEYIEKGNLKDLNAKDLESATWAGAASAFASQQATENFQGGNEEMAGRITGTREFFGAGLQQGLISFAQSEGKWQAGVGGAMGGMLNSDTANKFVNTGDGQILKGAARGAVQSSASGIFEGKIDVKSVLLGSAQGAVHTDAFARALPLTGNSDPRNSAMYGAFNGAFSSVVSGGDFKSTLVAAGTGAIGSKQVADRIGGPRSGAVRAVNMVSGPAVQLAQGKSLKAVGQGALASAAGNVVGSGINWAGNQISPTLSNTFRSVSSIQQAKDLVSNKNLSNDLAGDPDFGASIEKALDATGEAVWMGEVLRSFEPKEEKIKPGNVS